MSAADLDVNLCLNAAGIGCWAVCFWWMHRISQRQDKMLHDLHEQSRRIEEHVEEVAEKVR